MAYAAHGTGPAPAGIKALLAKPRFFVAQAITEEGKEFSSGSRFQVLSLF